MLGMLRKLDLFLGKVVEKIEEDEKVSTIAVIILIIISTIVVGTIDGYR